MQSARSAKVVLHMPPDLTPTWTLRPGELEVILSSVGLTVKYPELLTAVTVIGWIPRCLKEEK